MPLPAALRRTLNSIGSFFGLRSLADQEEERWLSPGGDPDDQLFMVHAPGRDFLRHPSYLWSAGGYLRRPSGLRAHLQRGIAGHDLVFCDALIVVNADDWERALAEPVHDLLRRAAAELDDRVLDWAAEFAHEFEFSRRGPQIRLERDGSDSLGFSLDLEPGSFATLYGPTVYNGRRPASRVDAEIWTIAADGSGEMVGVLWDDQHVFTLGTGAMDHGHLPELGRVAAVTLQRFGGEIVARRASGLDIEIRERVGARGRTLDVVDRDGDLVVELLVATVNGGGAARSVQAPQRLPTVGLAPANAAAPSVRALAHGLHDSRYIARVTGQLLRRVEDTGVLSSYTMDIDQRGRVLPSAQSPVARFVMTARTVELEAVARGVTVDGKPLKPDVRFHLDVRGQHEVAWPGGQVPFTGLYRGGVDGWPWLGRVPADGESLELYDGERYRIGRADDADVHLPDRGFADNVLWADRLQEGPVDIAGQQVERRLLSTDSIGVSASAAEIDVSKRQPQVENLSGASPLYVLPPTGRPFEVRRGGRLDVMPGSRLLVGNSEVAFEARQRGAAATAGAVRRRPRAGGLPAMIDGPGRARRLMPVGPAERDDVLTQVAAPEEMNREIEKRLLKIRESRRTL